MSKIYLQSVFQPDAILLSSQFIDKYMPRANGEFVKVYIYLLRCLSDRNMEPAPGKIADRLLCTEGDILRALRYWESEGLLSLRFSPEGELQEIDLCQSGRAQAAERPAPAAPAAQTGMISPASSAPDTRAQGEQRTGRSIEESTLTPDRAKELKNNEEIAQLLYVAEQYLGKTLSSTETRRLLFLYDDLGMKPDLIDYLIEYCVEHGHGNMRYIESVARSWTQDGITTVSMARARTAAGKKDYYAILGAMGITGRAAVESETRLMDVWLGEYGFSMEVIREACSRTVLQTGQASFPYADRILSDWFAKGVKNLDDIKTLDAAHQVKRREKAGRSVMRVPSQTPVQTRFHNFTQRENDYHEYEKLLLNQ
ncbi:MAG: DnaD domain protein [Blautia sp.]|nr:DnaD domain protein [Blautia sp.]